MRSFKTESKKILDMMINSVYTNREIFLRELISNASDAIDKLHFISLTDSKAPKKYGISITTDKDKRTLTISDNGIGMELSELEKNLGTIAKSGTQEFRAKNEKNAEDLIGQFGVGFYSTFMVASKVEVVTKKYKELTGYKWTSKGVEGYEIEEAECEQGTSVTLYLKTNDDDYAYDTLLDFNKISSLVKQYSDYIRYPITTKNPEKKGSKEKQVEEIVTLNSMVPLWKKRKSEVSDVDYIDFYKSKFHDYEAPLRTITASIEGAVNYDALVFVPKRAPLNYYSQTFERGLMLYSNSVLIMEKCATLLPDYLSFLTGIVDSADLSLNISREMLQHDRQLKGISISLEKKIITELAKMLETDRENYEKMFAEFGASLKVGAYECYGDNKAKLIDLLLFKTCSDGIYRTFAEYVKNMKQGQDFIYYGTGVDVAKIKKSPQAEAVTKKGYEILCFCEGVDEFLIKQQDNYDGKQFKSIAAEDIGLYSEDEKKEVEKETEKAKDMLADMKKLLVGKIYDVRVTKRMVSLPVCLTAEGDMSIEMERFLKALNSSTPVQTRKILELNPTHAIYDKLKGYHDNDVAKFRTLTKLLYHQALVLSGAQIDDTTEFVNLINSLI